MESGIYKITYTLTGAFYIGSAANFEQRFTRHRKQLEAGTHHSKFMQRVYTKHGLDALVFEIIERCEREQLLIREQHYLDTLNPSMNSYKTAGSPMGFKPTEEQRRRQSERQKGRKVKFSAQAIENIRAHACKPKSEEVKRKISESAKRRGTDHLRNPEVVAKVAAAHRGMKRSEETKRKISEAKRGSKRSPEAVEAMKALMRSPDMRARLSEKAKLRPAHNKGKPMSEEQKAKLSLAMKGRRLSEDHKQKIRSSLPKDMKHTEEAKKKIAESHKKFTDEKVLEIRRLYATGLSLQQLANQYSVQRHTIGRVVNGVGVYAQKEPATKAEGL